MLKSLKLTLANMTAYIIFVGIIKELVYFGKFHVPIKYFLSISEIGMIISQDLLVVMPLLLWNSYVMFSPRKNQPIIETAEQAKSFLKKDYRNKIIVTVILGIICIVVFIQIFWSKSYQSKVSLFAILFTVFPVFICFLYYLEEKDFPFDAFSMKSIVLLLMSISYLMDNTARELTSVEKGKYKGTTIVTDSTTYKSIDSAYYIGQTQSYIFFYDAKDKHTTIIPSAEVKKIELYSK